MRFKYAIIRNFLCAALVLTAGSAWPDEEGGIAMASYVELEPAFTINIGDLRRTRYIMATLSLRVIDSATELQVTEHNDAIRHILIMLFSEQTQDQLRTTEGRDQFLSQATKQIQDLMIRETGSPLIEMVLFTSFIMQP